MLNQNASGLASASANTDSFVRAVGNSIKPNASAPTRESGHRNSGDVLQPSKSLAKSETARAHNSKSTSKLFDSVKSCRENENLISFKSTTKSRIQIQKSRRLTPYLISRLIVENKVFVFVTTLLTIYALTGDDLRLLVTSQPADYWFDVVVVICLVIFFVEIVLSCLGKDDYYLGFFFTLDVVSTATLVLDLTPVANWMQGGNEEDDQASSLRGGRTARVGAKAGRIVRVIRLVRILKLYKAYYDTRKEKLDKENGSGPGDDDDWDDVDLEDGEQDSKHKGAAESRVGKKLSEMTIRKVIILVLTMLLVLPFLRPNAATTPTSAQYGAEHLWRIFREYLRDKSTYNDYATEFLDFVYYHNWYSTKGFCPDGLNCADNLYAHLFWVGVMGKDISKVRDWANEATIRKSSVDEWEDEHRDQRDMYNYGSMPPEALNILSSPWAARCNTKNQVRFGFSLLGVEVPDVNSHVIPCPEDLRIVERKPVRPQILTENQMEERSLCFYFDLRPFVRLDALYNLCTTAFICFVLCVASMYFSNDANRLVLTPVENMTKRVEAIRENPLIAIKMADEEFKIEEVAKAKMKKEKRDAIRLLCKNILTCQLTGTSSQEPMETVILEKTIIKLGSLLALGFGEAGANIIGHNMKGAESAGVNAMVPGERVECIIGIARIRNFAIATEVLQSKIMTFVNQIAEIVHGVVNEFQGAPNKNNGDTFVIIWQIGAQEHKVQSRLADMSVLAFVKVIGSMQRSVVLASYSVHPGLQQRLGSNSRVKMTFGLHCGWAIEGAVGSEFKIDASYLSPNVSIANSMEQATQTYGVPLIIAESVANLTSKKMLMECRLMDCVIVTGSQRSSMRLFTVDLDYLSLKAEETRSSNLTWNSRNRFKARQHLDNQKRLKMNEDIEIITLFNEDPNIHRMRRLYNTQFFQLFNMGYQNYSEGEWAVARRMLVDTKTMLGVPDGPSDALLKFMGMTGFEPPKDWKGVRDLK